MARLSISLLGPFHVTLDGRSVTHFESAKVRGLLAFLAADAARLHTRDALAELFWPDRPSGVALADLRHALATLRKAIGDATAMPPFLLITATTLQFNPAADAEFDLARFMTLMQDGALSTPADCRTALALRRGRFLDGCRVSGSSEFQEWLVVMTEQVDHVTAQAFTCLTADSVARGDFADAIEWSRRHLALEPWNEDVHRGLIRLLAMSGQTASALREYELCRRTLADELGVEPQPATQALIAAIRCGDYAPAQMQPAPVRLPPRPTTFFGRTLELGQIADRLADPACRLVTVLGPGGMGKTVFAIQAAHGQHRQFPDGVCFVDLAQLHATGQIPDAILRALGLPAAEVEVATERLYAHLQDRRMLLVLDNFEHLLAGAELLPALLQAAPGSKLLVTSRARLHLVDEWLLPLEGLETPPVHTNGAMNRDPAGFASVELFLQRARRLMPGFAPTAAELEQIAAICRLLEGMPLAIELAAAWVRSLDFHEITVAVRDRLDLLAGTLRDIPARHRSMQAVFDHSWRMLDTRERSMLRQLAVFRGGCTLAAADSVVGASLADLESLVDKSWLRVHDRRFSQHELMRQFCAAKLAEEHVAESGESAALVHHRHCTYFAGLTSAEEQALNWRREPMALFNAEFANLEAAWRWAIEQGEPLAIRQMMIGLFFIAEMTGWCGVMLSYFEDAARVLRVRRQNVELTSDQREEAGLVLTTILYIQTILLFHLGRVTHAREYVNEMGTVVAMAGDDVRWVEQEFLSRWGMTCLNFELGNFAETYAAAQDELAFVRANDFPCYPWRPEIGTRFWQMQIHNMLGVAARNMGDYPTAMQYDEEALALGDAIGEGRQSARNLSEIAILLQLRGEYELARATIHRGLELHRGFDDRINAAKGKLRLGEIELDAGHCVEARDLALHCLAEAQATDEYVLHLHSLILLARCARVAGDLDGARHRLEEAARLARQPEVIDARGGSTLALEWGHLACAVQNWTDARSHYDAALADAHCAAAEAQAARVGLAEVAWAEHDRDNAVTWLNDVIAHPATSAASRGRAEKLLAKWRQEASNSHHPSNMANRAVKCRNTGGS